MVQRRCGQQAVDGGHGAARLREQPAPVVGHVGANRQKARTEPVAQVVLQPKAQFFAALGLQHLLDAFANFAQRQGAQKKGFVGCAGKLVPRHSSIGT